MFDGKVDNVDQPEHPCRIMETRACPAGPCSGPCSRFESDDPAPFRMWMDGNGTQLSVSLPEHGPLLAGPLPWLVILAQLSKGELLRFTYDWTDPETGETTAGAARLVLEPLPDPRTEPPANPFYRQAQIPPRT